MLKHNCDFGLYDIRYVHSVDSLSLCIIHVFEVFLDRKDILYCRTGCHPRVGKIPWRRERLPTPVLWPGEFHGMYSPWGCKGLDTTEWLSLSHLIWFAEFFQCISSLKFRLRRPAMWKYSFSRTFLLTFCFLVHPSIFPLNKTQLTSHVFGENVRN